MKPKRFFVILCASLTIAGCTTQPHQAELAGEDVQALRQSTGAANLKTPVTSAIQSHQPVQVGRYSTLNPIPSLEQQHLLNVIIRVTIPNEKRTVGRAIEYLLRRSGYSLAQSLAQGPKVTQLFQKPLPEVHRNLGPMTLEDALLTVVGQAFRLDVDPVHRLVAFERRPDFITGVHP